MISSFEKKNNFLNLKAENAKASQVLMSIYSAICVLQSEVQQDGTFAIINDGEMPALSTIAYSEYAKLEEKRAMQNFDIDQEEDLDEDKELETLEEFFNRLTKPVGPDEGKKETEVKFSPIEEAVAEMSKDNIDEQCADIRLISYQQLEEYIKSVVNNLKINGRWGNLVEATKMRIDWCRESRYIKSKYKDHRRYVIAESEMLEHVKKIIKLYMDQE